MRHRATVLLSSALATATAVLALPAPVGAAVEGFAVTITEVPDAFEAGAQARTVEVVASTDNAGPCRKVRWSMVMRVDGVGLDQMTVSRVEEDDSFPLRVQTDGDIARLTDVRFDPGALCRGRTVTARYQVAFDDDAPEGRVTFQAQAFDAGTRLLQEASATSRVVGDASPSPSPSPSLSPTPEPEESEPAPEESAPDAEEPVAEESDAAAGDGAAAGDADVPPGGDLAARPASGQGGVPSLLGPGLIIGAALVFAGVGLLLRLRMRNRPPRGRGMPASFPSSR